MTTARDLPSPRPISSEPTARVLIVDDDAIVREIYGLALERAGYGVLAAADGLEGLEMVASARPDFVFLDIRMPKLDGIGVLKRIVADHTTREIPIVMLSNYDEPDVVRETLELGAKEYLVKVSIDPRSLPAVVSRWVRPVEPGSTAR